MEMRKTADEDDWRWLTMTEGDWVDWRWLNCWIWLTMTEDDWQYKRWLTMTKKVAKMDEDDYENWWCLKVTQMTEDYWIWRNCSKVGWAAVLEVWLVHTEVDSKELYMCIECGVMGLLLKPEVVFVWGGLQLTRPDEGKFVYCGATWWARTDRIKLGKAGEN